MVKVPPKFTTAQALKKAPLMKALGTWKTWFPVSERNYFGANIWLPARIIDGTVLQPGQSFEWWRALGPVTPARGYGPGGFIAGDHTEPTGALGGGMCSSSTTLFNAALRAGLQMGARSNYKYYISRYPLGLDATVSKTRNGSQTVSFTNDTKGPIVIRTFRYRAGGRGWVRYEIWGVPDGRTVSIGRPAVSNVRKATTTTEYVSSLPKGVREQIEYPADGMDVAVARVVRDRNGRIIHRRNVSHALRPLERPRPHRAIADRATRWAPGTAQMRDRRTTAARRPPRTDQAPVRSRTRVICPFGDGALDPRSALRRRHWGPDELSSGESGTVPMTEPRLP